MYVTLTEKLGVAWMGTRLQKGISVCNDETLRMGPGMWLDLSICSIGGYVLYVYIYCLASNFCSSMYVLQTLAVLSSEQKKNSMVIYVMCSPTAFVFYLQK